MTEDLRQMAKELAIQSGSETNPAPVETQEAFCKEAKEKSEYIIRVQSVTALRLKKWKYNPFGHFS